MLGLLKYTNKLFDIKWIFSENDKSELEDLLYVEFNEKHPQNNYFCIKNIHYTYIDILLGLEELDFILTKKGDDVRLEITKI